MVTTLSSEEIKDFQQKIWEFYKHNKRILPWRETSDPYKILVSEIMLQQTQVARVLPKYVAWINEFPDIKLLANASQSHVLHVWQGLGYNRRALSLIKLAKEIDGKFNGIIPLDTKALQSLPGVGEYTAGAIYTFSTNKPSVFIETNIRTVFLYEYFRNKVRVEDNVIKDLIQLTIDNESPREWYYALMDYGSHLKSVLGNINHISSSYAKQGKFQGSKRELRGKIIKELNNKKYLSMESIFALTSKSREEVESTVCDLINEGFLVESDGNIRFKD